MKALLLALAALLAVGPAAAYSPSLALAAAGDVFIAGNFCGPQRLVLEGAQQPEGRWLVGLSVVNYYPFPPCTFAFAFEGALEPSRGGCLPQTEALPEQFPLVLCLGPPPVGAGVLEVRVCFEGHAPCSIEGAYLAGDLLAFGV